MCGIAGITLSNFGFTYRDDSSAAVVKTMVDSLSKAAYSIVERGPDAIGALAIFDDVQGKRHIRDVKIDLSIHTVRDFTERLYTEIMAEVGYASLERGAIIKDIKVLINARGIPTTEMSDTPLTDAEIQPFYIHRDGNLYAVAHNGQFYNDVEATTNLPRETNIGTHDIDSYAVVKLLANPYLPDSARTRITDIVKGSASMVTYDNGELTLYHDYLSLHLYSIMVNEPRRYHEDYMNSNLPYGFLWSSEPLNEDTIERFDFKKVDFPDYSSLRLSNVMRQISNTHWKIAKVKEAVVQSMFTEPRPESDTAIIIHSGGLDSTVAAAVALTDDKVKRIILLHFKYGALAEAKEVEAVQLIAGEFRKQYPNKQIDVELMDMNWLKAIGGSTLTSGDESQVTEGELGAEKATEWVPARNMAMISVACAMADAQKVGWIYLGLNREESGAFNDNSTEFYQAMQSAIDLGTMQRPVIVCPLGNKMKKHIIGLGISMEVPLHLTWSCYKGQAKRCGTCGPCLSLKRAWVNQSSPFPF